VGYNASVLQRRWAVLALAAVLCIGGATGAALALASRGAKKARWEIHDLGTLPGLESAPVAINEHGQIVGYGFGAGVAGRAFRWQNGKFVDLGRCGHYSQAVAINEHGQAVGSCGLRPDGKSDHAFLWQAGRSTDLGTLGWASSEGMAINDRGQVVGNRFNGNAERAFLWQRGKINDLGTLGGKRSEATAISDRGEVVGESTTSDGRQHAFLWRRGRMIDLGALPGSVASAFGGERNAQFQPTAINNTTQIVGLAHDPVGSYEVAFRWQKGKLMTFGTFGGQPNRAVAINEHGQVLIQTTPPTDKRGNAYLWQKGKLTKLPSFNPNVPATFARTLNDQGQIAGTSLLGIGRSEPFVWQNGSMTPLPTIGGRTTAPITSVSAINNRGQIVGSNPIHLVMWTRQSSH
jgi:probable HAF family extracellular repeat protein